MSREGKSPWVILNAHYLIKLGTFVRASTGDQLNGLLQPWKGKLFEVSVRDRLNHGDWVGDYHLDAGQHAELAASATQPGWDLEIVNPDGSVADMVQLKATNYVNYVEHALQRYPEYHVIATSDLAGHVGSLDGLSVADIPDSHLDAQFTDAVSGDDFGLLGLGLPLIPLVLNTYWVATGERTVGQAAGAVALSAAAVAGGHVLGGIAADMIGDVVGDAVIDGIGSVLLDGIFGFGLFTLGRLLLGGSKRDQRKREREAQERAEQLRLEQLAIDSTCRRIDDAFERSSQALEHMGKLYLLPPPTGRFEW
jgi:hypothetical protein